MPQLVGRMAPEFALEGVLNGKFHTYRLSDYKGKWVILFFYPLDFTFVCPTEILAFSEPVREREDLGGAHEREVEGIEEKDDPFPLVIGKAIRVELAVEDALEGKFRGHSADELGHGNSPCAGLIFSGRGILAPLRILI